MIYMDEMFPEIDMEVEEEEDIEEEETLQSTTIGRTPLFNFETGRYEIKDGKIIECTQEEAVRQWVGFQVKTLAGKYRVYDDTNFGTYVENYIGEKNKGFVISEIKRELEEKAEDNRAIEEITDVEGTVEGDKLTISLTIVMTDETEVEVEVDV